MADNRNFFLVDMPIDKEWPLLKGLEANSGQKWTVAYREGRLRIPFYRRLWNFIFFPLRIRLFKKASKIIAWQQFYGVMMTCHFRYFCAKLQKKFGRNKFFAYLCTRKVQIHLVFPL